MDTDQGERRVAEPAAEELKKHGDPLRTQVADAGGKPPEDSGGERKDVPAGKDETQRG